MKGLLFLLVLAVAREECWLGALVGQELHAPQGGQVVPACSAVGSSRFVILVFASSTCDACVSFKAQLAELALKNVGEVALVFVSRDRNAVRFERHAKELVAHAVPWERCEAVNARFKRPLLPTLMVMRADDGTVLDEEGYFTVLHAKVDGAMAYWRGLLDGSRERISHKEALKLAPSTEAFQKLTMAE